MSEAAPHSIEHDRLRHDAIYGNHKRLRDALRDRANPAVADELGLTPLMYAVWNGHVECVKYLVCNSVGIDVRGVKLSSLHLKSCKGYTALHLAALDSPKSTAKEITRLLLVAGLDPATRCDEGFTPEELARSNDCDASLQAFREYSAAEHDPKVLSELESVRRNLMEKYTFIHNPVMDVEASALSKESRRFTVPEFIYDEQHVGALPEGMKVHEHQIDLLRREGLTAVKDTVEALQMLDFSVQQADINQSRRAKLLSAGDSRGTWESGTADLAQMRADKARAVIRAHSPYERRRRKEQRTQDKLLAEQAAIEEEIAQLLLEQQQQQQLQEQAGGP